MASTKSTAAPDAALLAEARSPGTAPERLEEIARLDALGDEKARHEVRAAVAANPNAAPRLLADLAPQYWEAFFRNPAGPLLALEVPDFWAGLSLGGLRRALRAPSVPWLRREARLHVSVAGEAGPDWEGALRFELRRAADEADPEEREANAEMAELGLAPPWFAGAGPAEAPPLARIDPKLLPRGSYLPAGTDVRREFALLALAAADPATTRRRLRRLAEERRELWPALAGNPAAPPDLLRTLGEGSAAAASVWRPLVRNPSTPADLVRRALESPDAAVRRAARVHPAAPKRAAELCRAAALSSALRWHGFRSLGAKAPEGAQTPPFAPLCRLAALLHPHTPLERVAAAARAESWPERLAPGLRPGVPTRAVASLVRDGNLFVRAAARARAADPRRVFEWECSG